MQGDMMKNLTVKAVLKNLRAGIYEQTVGTPPSEVDIQQHTAWKEETFTRKMLAWFNWIESLDADELALAQATAAQQSSKRAAPDTSDTVGEESASESKADDEEMGRGRIPMDVDAGSPEFGPPLDDGSPVRSPRARSSYKRRCRDDPDEPKELKRTTPA